MGASEVVAALTDNFNFYTRDVAVCGSKLEADGQAIMQGVCPNCAAPMVLDGEWHKCEACVLWWQFGSATPREVWMGASVIRTRTVPPKR